MTAPPLVSVYMATQNRAALLRRAIGSVLQQTFQDTELLIVDDGSSDGTPAVLAQAAASDSRVRVFRRDAIGGSAVARNQAIRSARGEFILGLDDDDAMLPRRIELLLAAYTDDYAFVCSPYYQDFGTSIRPGPVGSRVITLDDLLFSDAVGIQVLTRTSRMLEIGLFDESMPAWVDYDLFVRLVRRFGPGLRIPDRTALVTVNPRARRVTTSARALHGADRFFEKHGALMNDAQRRNHRLMRQVVQNERITLREARACWGPGTRKRVLRAWAASNIPLLVDAREAWWARRWPARKFHLPGNDAPDHD